MRAPLPSCLDCGRARRRQTEPRTEGTVQAGSNGLCSTCDQRARRVAKGIRPRYPVVEAAPRPPLTADEQVVARLVARKVRRLDERAIVLAELGLA